MCWLTPNITHVQLKLTLTYLNEPFSEFIQYKTNYMQNHISALQSYNIRRIKLKTVTQMYSKDNSNVLQQSHVLRDQNPLIGLFTACNNGLWQRETFDLCTTL